MSGGGQELMEVNGDFGAVEEARSLQGETITPIQPKNIGIGSGEPVFLQAKEEISIRRTV